MVKNLSKRVLILRDVPSNVIDEAILFLKEDAKIDLEKLENIKTITGENYILKEAESIIDDYAYSLDSIYAEMQFENKKKTFLKGISLACTIATIVMLICLVVSLFV